jgi:hypothetical protein
MKSIYEWYKLKNNDILNGSGLLAYYGDSMINMLYQVYADTEWHTWKFLNVPRSFWMSMSNRRKYFDWLYDELEFDDANKWYDLTLQEVLNKGGGGLLDTYYSNSLSLAIMDIYPEREWHPWKFEHVFKLFWEHKNNREEYLLYISRKLYIDTPEDWYDVSIEHMEKGGNIVSKYGGLCNLLCSHFTTYEWKEELFKGVLKTQRLLYRMIKNLFCCDVYFNHMHPTLKFPSSNVSIQLDVFVPHYSIAIEYQGDQHFRYMKMFGNPSLRQERDKIKKKICYDAGITIVEIYPSWKFDMEG